MLWKFIRDTKGATAIEYGLIAALISVSIIIGATSVGTTVNEQLDSLATTVTDARQ